MIPIMKKTRGTMLSAAAGVKGEVVSCQWETSSRPLLRPTWVEIDIRAFQRNLRAISAFLKKGTRVLAVVKANAYGHAAVPLSRAAVKSGVAMLGVSSLEEGIALRDAGITGPILIMGSLFPLENFMTSAAYNLIPTVSSLRGLIDLSRTARRMGTILPFHLKVDTGMGRVGVSAANAPVILDRIAAEKNVKMTGLYMHFSAADTDQEFTREQRTRFLPVVEYARSLGLKFSAHAASSSAIIRYPELHYDMVRSGISLYGLTPYEGANRRLKVTPVLSWKTRIVFLKRVPRGTSVSYGRTFTTECASVIATLPVGYADGYPRSLSNSGKVLVRGKRCPVVGRVTMDMVMVDVTGVKGVALGDEVILIGAQGSERITAEEIACLAKTINYETTCNISYRVPRIILS